MKRACILLLALMALASTVLGQEASAPTNQPDAPRIKPPTAAPAAEPPRSAPPATSLEQTLIAREKEVWEAIRKRDAQSFASYLAEDQLYVNDKGVYSKSEAVKGIGEGSDMQFTFDEWKVLMIDKDAAIVTYRVTAKGTASGTDASSVSRESTLWANRGGKWLAVFHQNTNVVKVE